MAAPVQFGADAIPIAWTAEAVALAWVASRRGHPYSAMVASGLYVLAGAYLVQSFGLSALDGSESPMTELAASLAFFIAGTGVGLWFLRDRSLRYAGFRLRHRHRGVAVRRCASTASPSWSC